MVDFQANKPKKNNNQKIFSTMAHIYSIYTESRNYWLLNLCHWGNWQMGTAGLESILISCEVDCVCLSIISDERVRSLDGQRFGVSAGVVQNTGLFVFGSITGFQAEERIFKLWLSVSFLSIFWFLNTHANL
jgi:hypothetical protein